MRRLLVLALGLLAACGGGAEYTARFARAATTAPPTTVASTSTTTTTSTSTTSTTTITPTTTITTTTTTLAAATLAPTLPPLPVPEPPPPEDGSVDPGLELGEIEIPRLGLARKMYEGVRLSTLDLGPGHWPGTAMPGELGNVVVAGHRVSHNEDFRNLDQLAPGDDVVFRTGAGRHVYRVVSTEIVNPDAIWIVDQTYAHTATLFACHPPGSVSQRIVVHLELRA
jgi:sortase A